MRAHTKPLQALIFLVLALFSPAVTFRPSQANLKLSPTITSPDEDVRGLPRPATTDFVPPLPQDFRCSPAPCVLPDVDVSTGPMPVNETPFVVNPSNPKQLLASANDVNCSNRQGAYTSGDGGTTWTRTCMNSIAGAYGGGDPAIGYDLQGNAYVAGLEYGGVNGVAFEKSVDNGKTWSAPSLAASIGYGRQKPG